MRRLLPIAVLVGALAAQAAERRYAIVIGVNSGDADEETLVYAERDAVRVADVMTGFGAVSPEDLALLRGPSAATVQRVLDRFGERIRAERARDPDSEALLIVYYSGHAGTREMHLRGTRLAFEDLAGRIKASQANVAVLVVDACRSGGLTRVKGGKKAETFQIKADDRLDSAGMAIITSSAAGEDAQESDRLRGGIFTHHLITGLLGGADSSGDQRVTLAEMYRYAHDQTIRTTSRTRFVQHPTYSFRMRGQKELTVTRLADRDTMGRLKLDSPGSWLVMEHAAGGSVVAEVGVAERAQLLLAPGRYLVRRRVAGEVWQSTVAVAPGEVATASAGGMSRVPFGRTVRKGQSADRRSAWSIVAGGEISIPVLPDSSLSAYGTIGAQVDLESVALQLRMRYGTAEARNSLVTAAHDLYGADVTAWKIFDLPRVHIGMGLGVRVGGDWLQQSFATHGQAPDRGQWVWRAAPMFRTELALGSLVTLTVDAGADIYLLDMLSADTMTSELTPRVVGFGAVGLGVYLP